MLPPFSQNLNERIPDGSRGRLDAQQSRERRGNVGGLDGTGHPPRFQTGAGENDRHEGVVPPGRTVHGAELVLLVEEPVGLLDHVDVAGALGVEVAPDLLDEGCIGNPSLPQGGAREGQGDTVELHQLGGHGSIANNDSGRYYGYRESKAALNMFTRSLAVELADEAFTCIVLSPGWVRTDMGGPNAKLAPEESISGMRKVIKGLTPADTGSYWNHDGEQLPW